MTHLHRTGNKENNDKLKKTQSQPMHLASRDTSCTIASNTLDFSRRACHKSAKLPLHKLQSTATTPPMTDGRGLRQVDTHLRECMRSTYHSSAHKMVAGGIISQYIQKQLNVLCEVDRTDCCAFGRNTPRQQDFQDRHSGAS